MESEGGNVKVKAQLSYSLAREISYHNKDGY
jgi:hypothetical protein